MKVTKDSYIIEDKTYDRVTSVLDYFTPPQLIKWRDKVGIEAAKQTMSNAKRIGTRVHGLCKKRHDTGKYKLGKADSVSVKNCMIAYERWLADYRPGILGMEKTIHNPGIELAGTLDIEMKGVIIDIKTSSAIRPQYWIQVAMYCHLNECTHDMGILRLDKFTADYEYKVIPFDDTLVDTYIGLLRYYRYITKKEVKDNGKDNSTDREIFSGLEIQ